MQNINQWIGEGNISCDPELRYTTDNSKAVTNFNLYIDSSYKNKNSSETEYIKRTCKVPVVAWAGKALHIVERYKKGDKVRLVGHLRSKELVLDGKKVLTFEIVAKNVYLIHKAKVKKNLD